MSTSYPWLADPANQQITYELAQRAVAAVDPDQLPFLEGIFPRYVELAQQGPVVANRQDRPFAFGPGDFVTEFIIACIIQLLQYLITAFGPRILKHLQGAPPDAPVPQLQPEVVRTSIQQALLRQNLATDLRLRVEDALTNAILLMLFPSPSGE